MLAIKVQETNINRELTELHDKELLNLYSKGNIRVFHYLFEQLASVIYAAVFHILRNHKQTRSVVAATFIELHKSSFDFKNLNSSISIWMLKKARHIASSIDYKDKVRNDEEAGFEFFTDHLEIIKEEVLNHIQ